MTHILTRNGFRDFAVSLALITIFVLTAQRVSAQARLSDKDVEKLMDNLKEDSKKFKSSFNSAISKSPIRNTDQEKQSKSLVEKFQKQTEDMLHQFKDNQHAGPQVKTAYDSAAEIDKTLSATPLGANVDGDWTKVKTELAAISKAFGIETSTATETSAK
jgi:hypothetical protein